MCVRNFDSTGTLQVCLHNVRLQIANYASYIHLVLASLLLLFGSDGGLLLCLNITQYPHTRTRTRSSSAHNMLISSDDFAGADDAVG